MPGDWPGHTLGWERTNNCAPFTAPVSRFPPALLLRLGFAKREPRTDPGLPEGNNGAASPIPSVHYPPPPFALVTPGKCVIFAGMNKTLKIIVEKHADGYVAYPVGVNGVVVGEGDTFEGALRDVKSAIKFHLKTFGVEGLGADAPALDAFIAETVV